MAADMLTIYLHYADGNHGQKILQRSMRRHDVSYYDLILMIEEVGFESIDYLYYEKKDPQGNNYLVEISNESLVGKMVSDPEIAKILKLYVFKEKASTNIAPSNHPSEGGVSLDGVVSGERTEQIKTRRPQGPLRRSKRLNVIQLNAECADGDDNNHEQYLAPGDESEALEDKDDHIDNQVDEKVGKRRTISLPIVWNMPNGQRIVVKCNEESQPIGDEGAILGKFLGTIARNGGYCPLDINDWRDVKKDGGEKTILQCIKTKFVYPRSCEKWILKTTGRDWSRFKASLKKTIFIPAIKKNPKIKRKALYKLCPDDVEKDQWRGIVKFWKSKKGKAQSEKNKISRSLVKNSHNAGTKSYARWGEDMRQADPEKKRPHRAKVYLATHKKTKNDSDKNERLARLEDLVVQHPDLAQNVNGRVAWEGDALQQVLGKEKAGQVHGMGLLPTPKQVYGRTPRYLKNINMTTADGSASEGETDVWEVMAKLEERIKRQDQIIADMKNKEGHRKNEMEVENQEATDHGKIQSEIVHIKRKRVQCNGRDEVRSLMEDDTYEDDHGVFSSEKDIEHDYVNGLPGQDKSSSAQHWVLDSPSEMRKTRDRMNENFGSLQQQVTRNKQPHSASAKRMRTPSIPSMEEGTKVILKTWKYPNKRQVAYATFLSSNPATRVQGVQLGGEFTLVRIDKPIQEDEELVRGVRDCKTIGAAFATGSFIAWPSVFIEKDSGVAV